MRVLLPQSLTRLFPGSPSSLDVEATTVADLIDALDTSWPGMRDRLCDSTPRIRRHVNVFIAGERATLATQLPRNAEIVIMTAISGG
jgi:molybdopterin converting factor small subunit